MGQQCATNETAQTYELNKNLKHEGVRIIGNSQSVYKSPTKSVYHFQKSSISSRLNPSIQKIHASLGNFKHSPSFVPPKGTIQPQPYTLNQQGLIYKQNSQWKNGMPHGRGQLLYPDGSFYVGYLINGIPHGQGRFISIDGWYYEGELQNQQAQGKGKFVYEKNRFQYEGNWAADLPDGFGKQTWKKFNGNISYQGQFLNGVKQGNGKYFTSDFNYEGRFQNNQFNGKGRIIYKNGEMYEGDFVNGKKHGHGIYRWPDHSQFEGQYFQDRKHGFGKYTSNQGKMFQGEWKNGKREGQGVVIHNNKKHYFDWKNNEASPQKKKF